MEPKAFCLIDELEQLKAVSDPLRVKALLCLIEKAHTGQQLAKRFGLARAKVHYHLNELERYGFIAVVHTELKNGIVQKFYRSVARRFLLDDRLLPSLPAAVRDSRDLLVEVLSEARLKAAIAPETAFWGERSIAMQLEVKLNTEKLADWQNRFRSLLLELAEQHDEDGERYYFAAALFPMEVPLHAAEEEEETT